MLMVKVMVWVAVMNLRLLIWFKGSLSGSQGMKGLVLGSVL